MLAKKVLTRMIYALAAIQTLLFLFDGLPWLPSLVSLTSYGLYLQNLRRFPVVKLTDPIFMVSCVLVLVNHWLWFRHFSKPPEYFGSSSGGRYDYYSQPPAVPTFTEIASFFGLMVWLVPFALFVSLSAGENVLPSMGSEYATGAGSSFTSPGIEPHAGGLDGGLRRGRKRANTQSTGMAKAAVTGLTEWIGETGELMGFWKGERTRPL